MRAKLRRIVPLLAFILFPVFTECFSTEDGDRLEEAKAAFDSGEMGRAFRLFFPLAENGNIDAQFTVAWLYQHGRGVEQNCVEALRWYKEIEPKGDKRFYYLFGTLHETDGCGKDVEEALRWYRIAASNGSAKAQHALAKHYENGIGVEKDLATAFHWEYKAARGGSKRAQDNLAWMYWDGIGVAENIDEAVKWFTLRAEAGSTDAQCALAYFYEYGVKVWKSEARADYWYKKATRDGASPHECASARG
ncbi:MAG: hypothetical protein A3G80_02400 [Betaproteobacteria bacterium RIFCSPLOWO2_12_FULL_62_13b]|nr:MAG: hypothetical protein A3G80_02400 [Betaproteobacteria bacterium RIFCSPLOWO2_12_FULL_62_13b]